MKLTRSNAPKTLSLCRICWEKADDAFDNTKALQKAINTASALGGGTVELRKGVFLSSPLELKSDVNLHLDILMPRLSLS